MLSVKYNARNFDSSFGKLLQGDNSLTLKWQDLVWSAITVGKRGYFELSSHKMSSIYEIAHRTFGVYAYLSDIGGYICRSDLYDSLDSTEKGGVSYSTGMMMAKLFSSKLLNTPWLIHLEKIDQSLFMLKGRSRPDLVGLTRTGDWIVVEAKGRTNGFSHMAQLYAKDQTRKLRKISGKLPLVRVAIQSYFDNTLQVKLEDPDDYDNNAVDVKIDINDYINTYYQMVSFWLSSDDSSTIILNNEKYKVRVEPDLKVKIAIKENILDNYQEINSFEDIKYITSENENSLTIGDENSEYCFYPDGLAIYLSDNWEDIERHKLSGRDD